MGKNGKNLQKKRKISIFFLILKGQQPFGAFIAPEKGLK